MIYALIFYLALANVGSNRYALDGLAARLRRNDSVERRH